VSCHFAPRDHQGVPESGVRFTGLQTRRTQNPGPRRGSLFLGNDRSWPNSAVALRPLSLVTRDEHESAPESRRCTVKNEPKKTLDVGGPND
jgi:hypothetical protein